MNNGVNPNNNNNGLNGEVLGNVSNTNNLNNPVPPEPETLETLDVNTEMPSNTVNTMASNPDVINTNNLSGQSLMQESTSSVVTPEVNPTPVTPEPAYTNPQTINPMPGFENSSQIGTTPPISLEPEKKPQKKKTNKTLFVIIIIVLLFGIGFGTYYVLKYTDLLNNTPKIIINAKDLEVNMGDNLSTNISDFADVTGTDIKNCNLNVLDVDTNVAGTYSYQVTCGEIYKKGTITVVDNTELVVETKKVYKVKGDTVEAKEFVSNPNDTYTYEFVDQNSVEANLNGTVGTYQVKIKATSGSKTLEVDAEMIILEHKIKGYLTCQSNEQNLANSSTKKVVQQRFAIADDGNSGFGKVAAEIYVFKFADETEYANYLATYKTEGTLTIDNVTGDVKFDDEALTITISNDKSDTDVINKYGANNMENYGSIRKYFMDTLGYECTYKLQGDVRK